MCIRDRHDEKRFEGTASELLEILHDDLPCGLRPNILSRWLNKHKGMPVSYTHLDVYKRQEEGFMIKSNMLIRKRIAEKA